MSRTPRIGVLALQGDVREHVAALRATGVDVVVVRDVRDLQNLNGLVIPGGESTTISKLAVRDGYMEPLRELAHAGTPMYGSCAGMIMLAREVLDGRDDQETIGALNVIVRRNAFGRQVDSFEADVELPALGADPFPGVFIRAPWIEQVGADVEVIGRVTVPGGEDRIVAVQSGPMLATSFHPELTDDLRVHEYFVTLVRKRMKDGV